MYTYPEAVNAFERIANEFIKALSPTQRYRVSVTPDAACTTASVSWDSTYHHAEIRLPVRPATARLTQDEFEDWTSYLLHEIGHPSFTDKTVWVSAVAAGLGPLVNSLEDVRMEKAIIASGHVANAKRVLSRLLDRKVAEARASGWKPNARKEFPWTVAVLGRAANGYDLDVSWVKAQLKPGSTVSKLLDWVLPELAACTDTRMVLELARRIEQVLKTPSPKGQESKGGKGGEGEEKGQGAPQSASEANEASDTDKQEKRTSDAPGGTEKASDKKEGEKGGEEGGDEAPISSARELEERELAPRTADMPTEIAERYKVMNILDILRDALVKGGVVRTYETGGKAHVAALRSSSAQSSKQRALLARALRANETEDFEGGRRSGRLDRGSLCRAVAGSRAVFGKRELREGFDTDVHILVDASGSMAGPRMEAATETALIVAQAAASVGAAWTVESFASSHHTLAGPVASRSAPDVTRFSRMARDAEGGTPLSVSMARAAIQQSRRAPQKRRVMFVITDGACDRGPDAVKGVADYIEKHHGTVLAHVSIHSKLKGSFKAEVQVPHNGSVAGVSLDHFVKVLQGL